VQRAIEQGATRVQFSEPLPFYVENFIGFPTAMAVPLGSYDLEQARWLAAENGIVLEIVNVTGGVAALDADGDEDADGDDEVILQDLGVSAEERQLLGLRYVVGQSLWRLTLNFFSRWDANWPGGAPLDAIAPNGGLPRGTGDRERIADPDLSGDGEIVFQNQALRKSMAVAGTPFTLTYQSDRQLERATLGTMTIPVTGAVVPASLRRAEVEIAVAGERFIEVFTEPEPNLEHTFTWDGKDAYGRTLQGWQRVDVEVRFVYPRLYDQPVQDREAFGLATGVPIGTFTNTRAEIFTGVRFEGRLGGWDAKEEGLGGWSLDVHHAYDPMSGTLNGGEGSERAKAQIEPVITTVAGGGTTWPIVEGVTQGAAVTLVEPAGVAVGADGAVYFSDKNVTRKVILRLDPNDQTLSTIAGGGTSTADGIHPSAASLGGPLGLTLDGEVLYLTEYNGRRVRRIDLAPAPASRTITTVAGSGDPCQDPPPCGEGGPATEADLVNPSTTFHVADLAPACAQGVQSCRRNANDGTVRRSDAHPWPRLRNQVQVVGDRRGERGVGGCRVDEQLPSPVRSPAPAPAGLDLGRCDRRRG
jgi:hypothetical protein